MKTLKNKPFSRWLKSEKISDIKLLEAIEEIERGLIDAELGGNVLKKRIPLGNKGKSKGARTILAFKTADRAVFMHGFSKKDTDNITKEELKSLKKLAQHYFNLTEKELTKAIKVGILIEVKK